MIATLDELAAGLAGGQSACVRKNNLTIIANDRADLFHAGGGFPANAANPADANGAFFSNLSPGAIPLKDPVAGDSTLIGRVAVLSSTNSLISIADRIWGNYLSAFGTAKITITFPAGAQRYADGEGVELYATILTALANTTAATWTVELVDQAGTLRTATAAYNTSGAVGRMIAFDLPAGVTGIKSVSSFQSSVAQASGAISLVLVKRLVELPTLGSVPVSQDGLALGLPAVEVGACLFTIVDMGSATGTGTFIAKIDFAQG